VGKADCQTYVQLSAGPAPPPANLGSRSATILPGVAAKHIKFKRVKTSVGQIVDG